MNLAKIRSLESTGNLIIPTLVIGGGPSGGKTNVKKAIKTKYGAKAWIMDEVATMLLEGGFPKPGRDLEWTPEWQQAFQEAIFAQQILSENAHQIAAAQAGCLFMAVDRGLFCGAPYLPGGIDEFCKIFKVYEESICARYSLGVIHLQSLAVSHPARYSIKAENDSRYETLERAQHIEEMAIPVWRKHPHRYFIFGVDAIELKVFKALKIIHEMLVRDSII